MKKESKFIERNQKELLEQIRIRYKSFEKVKDLEYLIESFCVENSLEKVFSKDKTDEITAWRQAFSVILLLNGYNQKKIGLYFRRHHSTIIYGFKAYNNELNGFGKAITNNIKEFIVYIARNMGESQAKYEDNKKRAYQFFLAELSDKELSKEVLREAFSFTLDYYEQLKTVENEF